MNRLFLGSLWPGLKLKPIDELDHPGGIRSVVPSGLWGPGSLPATCLHAGAERREQPVERREGLESALVPFGRAGSRLPLPAARVEAAPETLTLPLSQHLGHRDWCLTLARASSKVSSQKL